MVIKIKYASLLFFKIKTKKNGISDDRPEAERRGGLAAIGTSTGLDLGRLGTENRISHDTRIDIKRFQNDLWRVLHMVDWF